MSIKPVSLPTGAGISYGEGDVRHFSEGDAQDVPGLQNPTRYLSQRDNLLAQKLNEVISMVNNREQIVPIPVLRTTVAPSEEFTAVNYRIPEGFEARVLNATIASSPTSSNAQLDIYYDDSFGATPSGTAIVTTTSEFTAGTSFQNPGELIIVLTNNGDVSLEVVTSIILTMRPIGSEGSLLVGSTVKGEKGDPGPTGARGPTGIPGTGGQGSPGMLWRDEWMTGLTYNPPDVVSFPLYGTVISSYIANTSHVSDSLNQPPNTSYWDPVALGSAGSVQGVPGPAGADGVGAGPVFTSNPLNGAIVTHSTFIPSSYSAEYTAGAVQLPDTVYAAAAQEKGIYNYTGTVGMAHLSAAYRTCFSGSLSIILPGIGNGGIVDYTTSDVHMSVMVAGTMVTAGTATMSTVDGGTYARFVEQTTYTNGWGIQVLSPDPLPMSLVFSGMVPVP